MGSWDEIDELIGGIKMSLTVYTNKKDVPKNLQIIDYNDIYFSSYPLKNDLITGKILQEVDSAKYGGFNYFIGRDEDLGKLNKDCLSTGCKTLLNVYYNKDKCFNVIECGYNVLELLYLVTSGYILWEYPSIFCAEKDKDCDIIYNGKHYNKFNSFVKELEG